MQRPSVKSLLFAEQCELAPEGRQPVISQIWTSEPLYARQTAEIYQELTQRGVTATK